MTYKTALVIAYDGTDFSGWQVQPNAVSIQGILENLLQILLRHPTRLIGSGRTDAGVHALGQVAHFKHELEIDCGKLKHSLNGMLSPAIRILDAYAVPLDFHAQLSAKGKIYHYHLGLGPVVDPLNRLYRSHIYQPLDLTLLKKAAEKFLGTHDFTSFANRGAEGEKSGSAVRTLYRLDLAEEEGGIRLEFEGNGFLYKMVRNIVGVLVEVASGKRLLEEIPKLFAARDRRCIGAAAAPHGLFLVKALY